MLNPNPGVDGRKKAWWIAMFRDVQFWVPLAIFLGGLILLSIIQ